MGELIKFDSEPRMMTPSTAVKKTKSFEQNLAHVTTL